MTRSSGGVASVREAVRTHGADLHRTATLLIGDVEEAGALVASTLLRSPDPVGANAEELRGALVRRYVRRARARRDALRVRGPGTDAGDVLQDLPPRLRAGLVLHLRHGWSAREAARTARVRRRRLVGLVTRSPGLGDALSAVGDRTAVPDSEVVARLLDRLPDPEGTASALALTPAGAGTDGSARGAGAEEATRGAGAGRPAREAAYPGRGPRALRWVAAVVVPALVVVGLVAAGGRPEEDATSPPVPGLEARGWVLDEDGDPPGEVDGLRLVHAATIDYGDAERSLRVPGGALAGHARWLVLWCDLPEVDDRHLDVPEMTLEAGGGAVTVPCAGPRGVPALRGLTPAPPSGPPQVDVSWTGDLPGRGSAVLAVYGETDAWAPAGAEGTQAEPALVPGSVAVTPADVAAPSWQGSTHTRVVEIGSDSSVTVWAGSSLSLAVHVDGVSLTDDGDVAAMWGDRSTVDLWKAQDPQLREGRWFVQTPDQTRTFPLPEAVRPPPGQRRTVSVTVAVGFDTSPRWQVQVHDAVAAPVERALLPLVRSPLPTPDDNVAPEQVAGHRLVGRWRVPADGMPHAVEAPPGDATHLKAIVLTGRPPDDPGLSFLTGHGIVRSEDGGTFLYPVVHAGDAFGWGGRLWADVPAAAPPAPAGLTVQLPAQAGHPATDVLAYEPMAYEDFDFRAGRPLSGSWPVRAASPYEGMSSRSWGGARAEGGTVTFPADARGAVLRVTTEGRGRLRVLVEGVPLEEVASSHAGWWSSWTAEPVMTDVHLPEVVPSGRLSLQVEGWDERFAVDLLDW